MARPHIEFVQSQVLPFQPGLPGGARSDVACRILSIDDTAGDSSTQLRYSAGWRAADSHYLTVDEELFVLEGALEINGQRYGKHDYAHLPAGYHRASMSSDAGAVVLTFFSGEVRSIPSDTRGAMYDDALLVEHLNTRAMEGQTGQRKHMNSGDWDPSGTLHKPLFHNPHTGERSWLIGLMPYWSSARTETHPVVEEEFAILGDICFPMGVMRDGGYFWRPPGIEHGPFATWGGTLHLCRCKGGPFATAWNDSPGPNWGAAYAPILPADYQAHVEAARDYDREPNY
ncbi:MAG: DUF4437 domain-containing protein [Rhodospirillaceae bacterium]